MDKRGDQPNWQRVRFAEIAECVNDRIDNPTRAGVERYVGLEHLNPGSLVIRSWGTPDQVESTKLRFRPGDIIFGKRRAYQRKLAVAEFEGICSAHAMVLRPKLGAVVPDFLPFFMQSDTFMERAQAISVGSLSPTINWKTLATEEFTIPTLEEQQRIVPVLAAAEATYEASTEVAESANVAFHSTLAKIFELSSHYGKLTALNDVIAEGRPITYGILMPGTGFAQGVPVIKVKDYPNGYIDESDLLLTDPAIDEEYRRSRLMAGDLLISIRGTIGRLAFVPKHLAGANITQDTARLSIKDEVNSAFIRALLESPVLRRQMRSNITPVAVPGRPIPKAIARPSIQGINIGELRRLAIPLPTRSLQDAYSEIVDAARSATAGAMARQESARRLKLAIVARALGAKV